MHEESCFVDQDLACADLVMFRHSGCKDVGGPFEIPIGVKHFGDPFFLRENARPNDQRVNALEDASKGVQYTRSDELGGTSRQLCRS